MKVLRASKTKPIFWLNNLKINRGSGHHFIVKVKIFKPNFLSIPKSKLENLSASSPVYIHKNSNHPPHIKKGLHHMIGRRFQTFPQTRKYSTRQPPCITKLLEIPDSTRKFPILNVIPDEIRDAKER